jgi:hypothetical protein
VNFSSDLHAPIVTTIHLQYQTVGHSYYLLGGA